MGDFYSFVLGSTWDSPREEHLCSDCSAGCSAAFSISVVSCASPSHPERSPGLSVSPSYPGKLGRKWGKGNAFPYLILICTWNLTWSSLKLWSSQRPYNCNQIWGKAKQKRSRRNNHILYHKQAVHFSKRPDTSPWTNPGTRSLSRGFGIPAVHSSTEQMCPVRSLSGENNYIYLQLKTIPALNSSHFLDTAPKYLTYLCHSPTFTCFSRAAAQPHSFTYEQQSYLLYSFSVNKCLFSC